ncbi:MAG: DUF4186 domain-containing protein [Clostridia bacterium]|nr:DUF4186 domain-containing protein [Clostridia bacterium]
MTVAEALKRLRRSDFRAKFHLSEKDKDYVRQKGLDVIAAHGADLIRARLAPATIPNDGKQTPMKGHPIFVAQHACACCCRGCLHKWYKVPKNVALSQTQQQRILRLLMAWIEQEMKEDLR